MSTPHQSVPTNHTHAIIKQMTNGIISTVQLFGFDVSANEKQYKICLNATSFTKPNPKAFELIVHFLLCQLDAERAHKSFAQCWPPLLKEQIKEFKDAMFLWLNEIASPKQQQQPNHLAKYQHMLQLIKFPNITKSLLLTPGGLKICELLFALSQFVLLFRLLKLVDSEKLNIRVWPKVSPFTTPSALGTNLNEVNKPANAKFVTQKQFQMQQTQFDIIRNSLRHNIDHEFSEFDHMMTNFIKCRSRWQKFFQEKTTNIRNLIEKKMQQTQSLAKKKGLLINKLNFTGDDCSLEKMYSQFNESKLVDFEAKWSQFMIIKNSTVNDELKTQEITRMTNDESEKYELNGNDFIQGVRDKESQSQENDHDFNTRILNYVFKNIEQNAALRNANIGNLFHENGTKLDLINLIRLYNLVLILKGELYSKIDETKLKNLISLLDETGSTGQNQLFNTDYITTTNKYSNLLSSRKMINTQANEMKKKMNIFLPKFQVKNEALLESLLKTEETKEHRLLNEHFKFSKQTIKERYELFRATQASTCQREATTFDNQTPTEIENHSLKDTSDSDHNQSNKSNSSSCSSSHVSFQILDLSEQSNLELI